MTSLIIRGNISRSLFKKISTNTSFVGLKFESTRCNVIYTCKENNLIKHNESEKENKNNHSAVPVAFKLSVKTNGYSTSGNISIIL